MTLPLAAATNVQAAKAENKDTIVLAAADAAVAGKGISTEGKEADTAYNAEVGEIVNFGTDATITFSPV